MKMDNDGNFYNLEQMKNLIEGDEFEDSNFAFDDIDDTPYHVWLPETDSYIQMCTEIKKKQLKTRERCTKFLAADYLARIKIEENSNEVCNHSGRRVRLSTGMSISVDSVRNVGERTSSYPLETDFLEEVTSVCNVPYPHLGDGGNKIRSAYTEDMKTVGYGRKEGHGILSYNNPFDPRLSFNGITNVFHIGQGDSQTHLTKEQMAQNIFLALEDSDLIVDEHYNRYRKSLRDMTHISSLETPEVPQNGPTSVSGPNVSDGGSRECKHLFERIKLDDVKNLWSYPACSDTFTNGTENVINQSNNRGSSTLLDMSALLTRQDEQATNTDILRLNTDTVLCEGDDIGQRPKSTTENMESESNYQKNTDTQNPSSKGENTTEDQLTLKDKSWPSLTADEKTFDAKTARQIFECPKELVSWATLFKQQERDRAKSSSERMSGETPALHDKLPKTDEVSKTAIKSNLCATTEPFQPSLIRDQATSNQQEQMELGLQHRSEDVENSLKPQGNAKDMFHRDIGHYANSQLGPSTVDHGAKRLQPNAWTQDAQFNSANIRNDNVPQERFNGMSLQPLQQPPSYWNRDVSNHPPDTHGSQTDEEFQCTAMNRNCPQQVPEVNAPPGFANFTPEMQNLFRFGQHLLQQQYTLELQQQVLPQQQPRLTEQRPVNQYQIPIVPNVPVTYTKQQQYGQQPNLSVPPPSTLHPQPFQRFNTPQQQYNPQQRFQQSNEQLLARNLQRYQVFPGFVNPQATFTRAGNWAFNANNNVGFGGNCNSYNNNNNNNNVNNDDKSYYNHEGDGFNQSVVDYNYKNNNRSNYDYVGYDTNHDSVDLVSDSGRKVSRSKASSHENIPSVIVSDHSRDATSKDKHKLSKHRHNRSNLVRIRPIKNI